MQIPSTQIVVNFPVNCVLKKHDAKSKKISIPSPPDTMDENSTSSNLQMKINSIILEEVSTKQRIKGLREQENNSTLIKPKEINKDSEEKSSDINKNKRLQVYHKTRKGLQSFTVKNKDCVLS